MEYIYEVHDIVPKELCQEIIEKFKRARLDNPVLDSGIIMQRVTNLNKTMMFIEGTKVLNHREVLDINRLVNRRLKNEPIARIEKSKEFWGMEFGLNKDTLVPRPDSESVIESILENFNKKDKLNVLDLGTGSGCLLLSTLSEFKNANGVGVDLSDNALKQARVNARKLELKDRCSFIKSNWFSYVKGKFDIIISNPPYVKKDELLSKEVLNYDPHLALFAENNGLQCYEQIAKDVYKYLKPGGKLFLEIGVGQKTKVSCIMKKAGLLYHSQKTDLKGKIRCLVFVKN
jgi:release factor glutamine methyltransferase